MPKVRLIKKEVSFKVPKTNRAEGLMWVEVGDGQGKIFIAVIYLPSVRIRKVKEENLQAMDELSEDIFVFRGQGRVCVVGDFNCRVGELASRVGEQMEEEREIVFKRSSQDKKVNKEGKELVRFMNEHDLIIMNGTKEEALFTSIQTKGNSVIDYICCDHEMQKKTKKVWTWTEVFSIIGDYRVLTLEVEGRLDRKNRVEGGRKRGERVRQGGEERLGTRKISKNFVRAR